MAKSETVFGSYYIFTALIQFASPLIVGRKALSMSGLNSFSKDSNEFFFCLKKGLLGSNCRMQLRNHLLISVCLTKLKK